MPVLSPIMALVAAIGVVLVVLIAWKFAKLAFRIGLLIVGAVILFVVLRSAGYLGGT